MLFDEISFHDSQILEVNENGFGMTIDFLFVPAEIFFQSQVCKPRDPGRIKRSSPTFSFAGIV